ncbi:MAG: universal stress protein [Cyanobacteria bacterium J06621_11]
MVSTPFHTILVAIDESNVSEKAFAAAKELAKALGAKLIVVHVLNPHNSLSPQPRYSYSDGYSELENIPTDQSIREKYEREWTNFVSYCESLLKQKVDEATLEGIEAEFLQPNGTAGSALCEVAKTANASLMVVGSHQRRGMAEIMLGSTSNYITHHAPCSVMVVSANGTEEVSDAEANKIAANRTAAVV